jgi:hypothetical protein
MSELSEMLTAANVDGLSYDQIEARARAAGFDLSHGTAHVYMSGRHRKVSRKYLEALVAVFPSLKLDELMRAAELPPDYGPYEPPEQASALSPQERDALNTIIKSMAQGKVSTAKPERHLGVAAHPRKGVARPKRSKGDH